MVRNIGPYFWNGSNAIYHYHIWKIVPSPSLDKNFAFYPLQSITERVKGSTITHMCWLKAAAAT
jgi:type I restriction enzyme S subunit